MSSMAGTGSRWASACGSTSRWPRRWLDARRGSRGRSGELRSAAPQADARRLPHARLGRRCEARPRYKVEKERGLELALTFFAASRSGDMSALGAMLAADVSIHSDGGGKRPAAVQPVIGLRQVTQV